MHRIALVATLWAFGCVPALDDCVDDDGCSATRTCQSGYCLPPNLRVMDARVPDRGADATPVDAALDALVDAAVDAAPVDAAPVDAAPVDAAPVDAAPVDATIDAQVRDMRPANSEACNGADDDGDGRIDENYLGDECVSGFGPCRRTGDYTCDGGEEVCDAIPDVVVQDEACNGVDDDCDGRIDEAGNEGLCCTSPETCNGLDDDCDGRIDEFVLLRAAREIARHSEVGGPKVLQIAATNTHVGVLTNDQPAGRAVLQVYDRANLALAPRVRGIALNDGLVTQMIAHGGKFIIAAPEIRAGVQLLRVSLAADGFVEEPSSAALRAQVDQLVIEAHADGRISLVAHGVTLPNESHWFEIPADFGAAPIGISIPTPDYDATGGFAAGLWNGRIHLVWTTAETLRAWTVLGPDMREDPGWQFGAEATRPYMTSFGVAGGAPVLLWQTTRDAAMPGLGVRKLNGGQSSTIGPVRGDRPTGAAVDAERVLVGWRTTDGLVGRVGLVHQVEQSFDVEAELSTGATRRAPVMAVGANTVSVAWLAQDGSVHLQHHMLECPAQ